MSVEYYSASEYYKNLFNCKVYKISLDAGCTCPTRDGMKGVDGCIFCSAVGSGEFASNRQKSITEQIEEGKRLVSNKAHGRGKNKDCKYIAYFQNFTNTYGNADELEAKYLDAINGEDVVGIAIATRPDCLSDDILFRIGKISETHYVSIELGLQTTNEKTASYIRRAYPLEEYDNAVKRIHEVNEKIHVVTHLIFGLPFESKSDMLSSVKHCVSIGTDGFKFTVLFILKNTDLEKAWAEGKVRALEKEEYFEIVKEALTLIPSKIVIHRLTGDGDKKSLLAPLWTADKKRVMNDLKKYLSI
jgi:radical SAM protein (TIGR01212 family)